MKKIEEYVRSIPDFPEKGIIFRDITSVLQDADGLKLAIDSMIKLLDGVDFDVVVGTESRGFIFGVPIAYALGKPFVPVRKKGKLPCETISEKYDLEYGSAEIETVSYTHLGYAVRKLVVNGEEVQDQIKDNVYTVQNVSGDVAVSVSFRPPVMDPQHYEYAASLTFDTLYNYYGSPYDIMKNWEPKSSVDTYNNGRVYRNWYTCLLYTSRCV